MVSKLFVQIQVLKKAWNNAPMTVQEDVMRTLDCCGYDHTEYMNKWVDDDTNVRTPSSGYYHDFKGRVLSLKYSWNHNISWNL